MILQFSPDAGAGLLADSRKKIKANAAMPRLTI